MKKGASSAPFPPDAANSEINGTKGEVSEPQRAQFSTAKSEGCCTPTVKEPPSNRPSHTPLASGGEVSGESAAKGGKPTEQECHDLFDRFWILYPKPYSKYRTRAAWRHLNPTPELLEVIIEDFTTRQKLPDWTRENGRFIPNSENYLKSRAWLDWDHPRAAPPPAIGRYLARLGHPTQERATVNKRGLDHGEDP